MSDAAIEMATKFRDLLKAERIRRRISQVDLAKRVNRSRKWLSDFERGIIDPSFVPLIGLAMELDVKIEFSAAEEIQ